MKKLVSFFIAAVLLFSITACGNPSDADGADVPELVEESKENAAVESENITTDEATDDAEDVTTDKKTDESQNEAMVEAQSADSSRQLDFSATDLNGVPIKLADIKGASLIMVNFWEPWCGPCVGEMPELEKLYQDYKDQGLIILGVFYSTSSMDGAKDIVSKNQITYPILIGNDDFGPFTTEYVPTTVFFDSEGNLLNEEAVVGAQSYDAWEQEIAKYLDD